MTEPGSQSLRERKKRRTRSTLVDVAIELCLSQGYDKTTVEQIAAAADVSPRTFSRYFPTKDAVVAAIADDMDEWLAEALMMQPTDISEYEALLQAHLVVYASAGPYAPAAFQRMAVLIQIINTSPTLTSAAATYRQDHSAKSMQALAERMDLPVEHAAVRIVSDVWTAVFASVYTGMGQPGDDPIEPDAFCERLTSAFEVFTRTWTPWGTNAPGDFTANG